MCPGAYRIAHAGDTHVVDRKLVVLVSNARVLPAFAPSLPARRRSVSQQDAKLFHERWRSNVSPAKGNSTGSIFAVPGSDLNVAASQCAELWSASCNTR